MIRLLIPVIAASTLAGCVTGSYCLGEQPYMKAQSVPLMQTVDGLKLPESGSTLKIPPAPANPVPYGQKVKDANGKEVVQCLDQPPPMAPPAEAKPAS